MSLYESIFQDVMLRLHDRNLQAEIKAFVTSLEGDNVGKNVGKQLNERQRVIIDPAATGFSFSNVKYMKQWYSFYAGNEKSQRTIGQIAKPQF